MAGTEHEKEHKSISSDEQEMLPDDVGPDAGTQDAAAEQASAGHQFPVVGIGASAGGLDAFKRLFSNMPEDTGMAFLVVQHLDPDRESILGSLITEFTPVEVVQAQDGMQIEPNTIYLLPPDRNMALDNGVLHLTRPVRERGPRLPIDFLFRSLAEDRGENAIAVILSGTGSDGTLGLKAVKGEGGMVMVQSPDSAGYDGMPQSALATQLVDFVLPPEEMPEQLITYVKHEFFPGARPRAHRLPGVKDDARHKIFAILRVHVGHDFSHYKKSTINRRIERRMAVNHITDVEEYAQLVRQSTHEAQTLFRELLIGVTSFFRDSDAFEALRTKVIPEILRNRPPETPIRVWVPGCATGEEAYSIAILLKEAMEAASQEHEVQIFATDIDPLAIDKARMATYPENIAADISDERLRRFFHKEDGSYRVAPHIRDMVIFAEQSVIKDPPFSRLDLISCRNLLIYLDAELQKIVIPLFHYALKPGGFLMLGTSESLGKHGELFATIDRKNKLFRRAEAARVGGFSLRIPALTPYQREATGDAMKGEQDIDLEQMAERILLMEFTPPSVIINERNEILYIHKRTGKYLEPAAGQASLDVLRMAREGLRTPLAAAIRAAKTEDQLVQYANIPVRTNGDVQLITLTVKPIRTSGAPDGLLMLVFEEEEPLDEADVGQFSSEDGNGRSQRVMELERELQATREYLQTTIEELETSNEELKSTNEELQSSNEELQSTNEELETAKEELQSVNEELTTVNAELESKVDEVTVVNNDLRNLLASIEIGIVFLDQDLRVQRFNPSSAQLLNLIESDVGRPIQHINTNLRYDGLVADAQKTIDTLIPQESVVQSDEGDWYQLRVRPYRTLENAIQGVVMTFSEIETPSAREVDDQASSGS